MSIANPTPFMVRDWISSMIASSTDLVLFFISVDGLVIAWEGASERVFGYTAAEAIGMQFGRLFTDEARERGLDRQEMDLALASGRSEDDRWHLRKDGSMFWASGVLQAIRNDGGEIVGMGKWLRDKTDVRTQLEVLQNQLKAKDDERSMRTTTLANVAHELRNIVMSIKTSIELAKRSADEARRSRAFALLDNQMPVLSTLLDDVNDVTESVLRPPTLNRTRLDLQTPVKEVAESFADASAARRQHLRVTLPPHPIWIDADAARLAQMLINLIGNAVKYTPEGGAIDVSATVEGEMAVVRVEDNGVGISAAVLPHIFELFTRDERQRAVQGLGVGLAVVKQFAVLHGGNVEARSAGDEKGSIFTLRLPVCPL